MSKPDREPVCYRIGCDLEPKAGGLCLEHALDDALDMLKEGSGFISRLRVRGTEDLDMWSNRALNMVRARRQRM